jgi:hypothetical protein
MATPGCVVAVEIRQATTFLCGVVVPLDPLSSVIVLVISHETRR